VGGKADGLALHLTMFMAYRDVVSRLNWWMRMTLI
jgi:hypothetical protein